MFATFLLSVVNAFAGPSRTTYQAKIVKPDGYPLEASSVNFKFTLLDPAGLCILYSETYSNVNMNSTGGLVSFSLGSGVKTYPVSSPTFEDVFSNITANMSCDAGGPPSYSPLSSDIRKIVMQFHDGNGWQTLPAMNINAVPYAMYATNAEKLGGVSATSFVQDSEIPTCPGGQALTYNGTMFSCIVSGGGAVSAAAVTAALGYTPADSASFTTVASNVNSVSTTVYSLSTSFTSLSNSVAASFAAIAGSGISTFNGSTSATQSLANGTAGTAPAFVTAAGVHTLNIPFASAGATTAGVISNADYSLFSTVISKITSSAASVAQVLGYTPADQAVVTNLSSTVGAVSSSVNSLASTVAAVSTTANSKITSSAASVAQVLGYTPVDASVLSSFQATTAASFSAIAGSGISTINGSTSGTQSFANGTAGNAPAFVTAAGVHTLNIPFASAGATTAGLISNSDYSLFSTVVSKITSSAASVAQVLGYIPADQAAVTTLSSTVGSVSSTLSATQASLATVSAAVATANSNIAAVSSALVTTNSNVSSVSSGLTALGSVVATLTSNLTTTNSNLTAVSSAVNSLSTSTAASFAALTSSQWATSGTTVNYMTGNVGIGTTAPAYLLDVSGTARANRFYANNGAFNNPSITFGANPGTGFYNASGYLGISVGGGLQGTWTNSSLGFNAGGAGPQIYFTGGNAAQPSYAFNSDPDTGMYNPGSGGSNELAFSTSGVERVRFTSGGAVGIATATPSKNLHVASGGSMIGSVTGFPAEYSQVHNEFHSGSLIKWDQLTGNSVNTGVYSLVSPAVSSTKSNHSFVNILFTDIPAGASHTGSNNGMYNFTVRNRYAANTDNGYVQQMIGFRNEYGHQNSVPGNTPTTYALYGAVFAPQNLAGTINNLTDIYIAHPWGSGSIGEHYSIYQESNSAKNYFAGKTGFGHMTPNALVHLGSGSTTVAPLKLTSGPLTASPASGAIEYDGLNYYITDGTNTRRAIATVGGPGASADFTGTVAASGSVISPAIYGGSAAAGNLIIDSTNNATKGKVIIAPSGGFVGVGTSNPTGALHVVVDNAATAHSTITDAFLIQNKNTAVNALTSIVFANQDGFGTGQISARQNSGNVGSQITMATKTSSGSWNTSQIVLNTNNRIGMGTSAPSAKLDVVATPDTTPALYVGDSNTNGATGLYFSRWGSASAPMGIQGTTAGVGANTLVLQGQAGNVGIGTASATEKLTVYDGNVHIPYVANKTHGYSLDIGNNMAYIWRNYSYADDSVFFSQNWYANDAGTNIIPNVSHTTQAIEMRRNVGIVLKTGATNTVPSARLTIDPNGEVGIGTTTPGSRLHITSPASASVNNRLVTGNSNTDLMDATGLSGDVYLDHIVSARLTATTSTTINKAATLKIDTAPTATSGATIISPYALWIESGASVFGGNVGVGVSGTPSAYGHGGTNKVLEIQNSSGASHSQAHLVLSSGVSNVAASSLGTITWAQPNVTSTRKEVAWIGVLTESALPASPSAYLNFNTRSTADAAPIERMRITGIGNVGIATTNPTSSLLTNIAATAVNSNSGDQNGTGQNSESLSWSTNRAGYSVAITNTSLSSAANGLQVRTLATSSNNTVFTAGIGVSSTANTSDFLTVKSNGRVGVNTPTPIQILTVNGTMALQPNTADHIYMEFYARTATPTTRSGWLGFGAAGTNLMSMHNETGGHVNLGTTGAGKVGVNNPNPSYMLDVAGTLRGFGITDSSDIRLKKDIYALENPLDKILKVQGVSYYWKDQKISEKKQIGFIAQQLEKVFPELVETDKQGMKSVNYSHLVSPLVEAVKSLYAKITNVEAKQEVQARELASVKNENEKLKEKNEELEKRLERLERAMNKK